MKHIGIPAGTIVVGIDGSEDAERAVVWAVRQAVAERRSVTLVHATDPDALVQAPALGLMAIDHRTVMEAIRDGGRELLATAAALAAAEAPDVSTYQVLVDEDPRRVLTDLAHDAHLVVIGSRGRGPLRSALLGSVSTSVARHAAAPVVVCRPLPEHGDSDDQGGQQRIVVGADGAAGSGPALEFAFRQASLRRLPLTVMHCFWDVVVSTRGTGPVEPGEAGDPGGLRRLLAESVAGLREKFPDVEVTFELARGLVDDCLAGRSPDSVLIVVGRPDAPLWARFLHASCAIAVLERARCAVAVVPEIATEDQLR